MARFGFGKSGSESEQGGTGPSGGDEGLPPLEGDLGDTGSEATGPEPNTPPDESSSRARRLLIIGGLGVVLVGGAYLANQLFLTPGPSPVPVRPLAPSPAVPAPPKEAARPPASAPVAKAPVKPETPTGAPTKAPASSAPMKAVPFQKAPAAPSKTEAKTPPPAEVSRSAARPAPAQAGSYSLQVGAMVMEENAENLKRQLDHSGFQAVIRKGTAFITKHVVTVGDATGRPEAEELARRLNVDGFSSQLLTVDGKFTPQIGAFFNLNEAIDLARELQKKSYRPKISSKPANTVVFQVRHGRFETRAAAVKRGEELKAKGFAVYSVVRN